MKSDEYSDERPDPVSAPEAHADWLFDVVSGNLRDRPEPGAWTSPPSRATKAELRDLVDQAAHAYRRLRLDLVAADASFDELHEWIMCGKPLPGPWRKRYVPRVPRDPRDPRGNDPSRAPESP